eukprot:8930760-Alexandrium_andersonii.AAC.1
MCIRDSPPTGASGAPEAPLGGVQGGSHPPGEAARAGSVSRGGQRGRYPLRRGSRSFFHHDKGCDSAKHI